MVDPHLRADALRQGRFLDTQLCESMVMTDVSTTLQRLPCLRHRVLYRGTVDDHSRTQ